MAGDDFQRARSAAAKSRRRKAILAAARQLGERHGVRQVTLTDIADAVALHKSGMLRYFETREQIFLELTAAEWRAWSRSLRTRTADLPAGAKPAAVATALAESLVGRPLFCDLLAQTPLNLERNVSRDAVRAFKLDSLTEVEAIAAELVRLVGLTEVQARDVIATATSLAGAFWQMATPGPAIRQLYRTDPRLAHAIVDVGPRLSRLLTDLITGMGVGRSSATRSRGRAARVS